MASVGEIYGYLDRVAPFKQQEKWDNSGLLAGDRQQQVNKAMLALDITNDVVNEAIILGARLVISHHPVIFDAIKSITAQSEPIVYKLIKHDISAICAHTSLDIAQGGVNDVLARALGLKQVRGLKNVVTDEYFKVVVFVPKKNADDVKRAMAAAGAGMQGNYSECSFEVTGKGVFRPGEQAQPFIGKFGTVREVRESRIEMICPKSRLSSVIATMKKAHPYEEPAYDIFINHALKDSLSLGRVGMLEQAMTADEFAAFAAQRIRAKGVRYTRGSAPVKTVALCGGAGGEFLPNAIAAGADAYVTGDVKHNVFVDAKNQDFTLLDAGHFATEMLAVSSLKNRLQNQFSDVEFILGKSSVEPVNYI
ncbi:MAG: Nif3-like dinuclear metal center hexameric protein [Acetanaerobacterium sp.]